MRLPIHDLQVEELILVAVPDLILFRALLSRKAPPLCPRALCAALALECR